MCRVIMMVIGILMVVAVAPCWAKPPISDHGATPLYDFVTQKELKVAYESQLRAVELARGDWTVIGVDVHHGITLTSKSGERLQLQFSPTTVGTVVRLCPVTQLQVKGRLRLGDPSTWLKIAVVGGRQQSIIKLAAGRSIAACETYAQGLGSRWFELSDLTFRSPAPDVLKGEPRRWIMRYEENWPIRAYEVRVEPLPPCR